MTTALRRRPPKLEIESHTVFFATVWVSVVFLKRNRLRFAASDLMRTKMLELWSIVYALYYTPVSGARRLPLSESIISPERNALL